MVLNPTYILIACQRQETCTVLEQMLQELDYRTTVVGDNDLRELDGLKARNFHLAIFDLPFLEAHKERILEQKRSKIWIKSVPTIIAIAQNEIDSAAQWLDLTASDFLIEPLHPQLLKVRLQHGLAGQQYLDGVSGFVGLLAHEIKSPLASIRGYTELLLGKYSEAPVGPLNEQQVQFLHSIERNGLRMLRSIEVLRDYVLIENNHFPIDFMRVTLNDEINGAIASIRSQANEKSQELKTHLPDKPIVIEGEAWRLQQALFYLLENACHYTLKDGQIDFTLEYLPVPNHIADTDMIHITIKDTGIGIPDDEQHDVFRPFWRSQMVYSYDLPRTAGIGLSLYITKAIVEAHGGQIWFESKETEGSTFHITLPASH
jgi:signal transduction histidine kinase